MRCLLSLPESPKLFVLRDVQPELDQDDPTVDKLLLEMVDLSIRSLILLERCKTFDAFHQHPAVPAAVEDRQLTGAREMTPEAPKIMMSTLFVRGGRNRNHVVVSGIECPCDPTQRAALARCVPALEHGYGRDRALTDPALEPVESSLLLFDGVTKQLLLDRLGHIESTQNRLVLRRSSCMTGLPRPPRDDGCPRPTG